MGPWSKATSKELRQTDESSTGGLWASPNTVILWKKRPEDTLNAAPNQRGHARLQRRSDH
jgi:hypothetical protein